ncbi:hypothetical protein SDJN03_13930, partial [Cucurbita argyrosperma subsp. sororia]
MLTSNRNWNVTFITSNNNASDLASETSSNHCHGYGWINRFQSSGFIGIPSTFLLKEIDIDLHSCTRRRRRHDNGRLPILLPTEIPNAREILPADVEKRDGNLSKLKLQRMVEERRKFVEIEIAVNGGREMEISRN